MVARDSVLWAGRGVSIGSEVSGRVEDVLIANVSLHGPSEHGLHIKTAAARGGFVRNVKYVNMTIGRVLGDTLLGILTDYGDDTPQRSPAAATLTEISAISWKDVRRTQGGPPAPKGAGAFGYFGRT